MILVTGAAGKTGRAVIQALAARDTAVRALIHHQKQNPAALSAGAKETIIGDMADLPTYHKAMTGVSAVYFICPNVNPNEFHFAQLAVEAAQSARLSHFVYHSVLHPQIAAMPHHWLKMQVEAMLFESGLSFTILQPTAYMQNILASWETIMEEGVYRVAYSAETRLSMVELHDLAQAAASVLLDPGHEGAIYEIAGTNALSQIEVAGIIAEKIKRPVRVERISLNAWRQQAQQNGVGRYQIDTLIKMFNYYDEYGLHGNPNILGWLLKRPPTTFAAFIDRFVATAS